MVRLFAAASPPTAADDASALTVAVEIEVSVEAQAVAILYFQPTTGTVSTVDRTVAIYEVTGANEGTAIYTGTLTPSGTGWQSHTIAGTVLLDPTKRYRAAVHHPAGGYVATSLYFASGPGASGVTVGILTAPSTADTTDTDQGSFRVGSPIEYPTSEFNSANYWVDLDVAEVEGPPPIIGFTAHDGTSWLQGHGWAHNGTAWAEATPAIP